MKPSFMDAFAKCYAAGWVPLLGFFAAPLVTFPDVSALAVAGVLLLTALGYTAVRTAQGARPRPMPLPIPPVQEARAHVLAVLVFSLLSVVGCLMVRQQQAEFLGDMSFDNLQERYIALVESSLQGESTSSVWSSLGNLLRSFFFVAVSSFVAVSAQRRPLFVKLALAALMMVALIENFLLNVSRLQFVFFLLCAAITAIAVDHPLMRRKGLLASGFSALVIFLVVTTSQRFDAKFGDPDAAAGYITTFFGVELLPLGRQVVQEVGIAFLALSIYITQGIPELIRLVANNPSPYSMGGHSLFLLLSPLLRPFGIQLEAGNTPPTNQGFWWGFMGDLYLDFGVLFPLAYLVVLYTMVRVAARWGNGPVYGLALRTLTAGMLFIVPYTGIFNTYAVSYFGIAVLARREQAHVARRMPSGRGISHGRTPT